MQSNPPPYNPKEAEPLIESAPPPEPNYQQQQQQQMYPPLPQQPAGQPPYYGPQYGAPGQPPPPGYMPPSGPPYPPQGQPAATQQPAQGGTVYVINPPISVVTVPQFGYTPARTNCPHCHADIVTTVEHDLGTMAWLACGIIVLVGLFLFPCALLGCCFIPFCINDCKDVVHICPSCRQTLARVPRLR